MTTAKVQPVSTKRDNLTWCRPSKGYTENSTQIDIDGYVKIATVTGQLPESDEVWPKGAPIADTFRFGNQILRKK